MRALTTWCLTCILGLAAVQAAQAQVDGVSENGTAASVESASTGVAPTEAALFRALKIQFASGGTALLPHTLPVLDAVAGVLIQRPDIRLEISGHTDAVGSPSANERLARERAESVKRYLTVRHRIAPDRLEAVGYGSSIPAASNDSRTGRALNRRVEFRPIGRADAAVAGGGALASTDAVPTAPREPMSEDTLRAEIRAQVEEAIRAALAEADTLRTLDVEQDLLPDSDTSGVDLIAARERELQDRLDRLEDRLADDPTRSSIGRTPDGLGLLPFTGTYVRGNAPVVLGIRFDIPTSLLGSSRFQPDAAVAFSPDHRASLVNANLVFPVRLDTAPAVLPFFGLGVGFHNIDALESVLNLLVGLEYDFHFGVLFAELMTQDFADYNRLIVGFRQNL